MALITCPECGQQVSDRAKACPHWAAALERPRDYRGGGGKQGSGGQVQWSLAACSSLAPLLLAPEAWLSVRHLHSSFLVHVIWEKLSTRPSTLHQAPGCDAK